MQDKIKLLTVTLNEFRAECRMYPFQGYELRDLFQRKGCPYVKKIVATLHKMGKITKLSRTEYMFNSPDPIHISFVENVVKMIREEERLAHSKEIVVDVEEQRAIAFLKLKGYVVYKRK